MHNIGWNEMEKYICGQRINNKECKYITVLSLKAKINMNDNISHRVKFVRQTSKRLNSNYFIHKKNKCFVCVRVTLLLMS